VEKITRAIITDLYPLYVAGEASGDTRQLVEEFLAKDPEFARLLTEGGEEFVGSLSSARTSS